MIEFENFKNKLIVIHLQDFIKFTYNWFMKLNKMSLRKDCGDNTLQVNYGLEYI